MDVCGVIGMADSGMNPSILSRRVSSSDFQVARPANSAMYNVRLLTIRQRLHSRWLHISTYRRASSLTGSSFDRHREPLQSTSQTQWRGAKSKATVSVNELLGSQSGPALSLPDSEDAGPAYPTVVQQARSNMRKYDNCVLLTRVGSFYEV